MLRALHDLVTAVDHGHRRRPALPQLRPDQPGHRAPHPRHHQQEPDDIAQKPRKDQQHGPQRQQRQIGHERRRPGPPPQRHDIADSRPAQYRNPRDPGCQNRQQDAKHPDPTPDNHETRDLKQHIAQKQRRDAHKSPQRQHPYPGMVDLAGRASYIGTNGPDRQPPGPEVPMNSPLIQLLVLAGIAVFLILKLRSVLGTREGYEKPPLPIEDRPAAARRDFEVIEGGPDRDIIDHVPDGSEAAKALAAMKLAEPGFSVSEFLSGARGAYEMILMAFERGELDRIRPFLSDEVEASFAQAINAREREGLTVEASFVGLRELALAEAEFDRDTREGEITVRFLGEITSVVRNKAGEIVESSPTEIKRQRDSWTFARVMGESDPNWQLVATGD